ncbi:hypothetical protein C8A05DRAFT_14701 [Staphylotrichum tortipilum]|uniref:FAD/NAD(P)-binding domain-containing protein n=1 Tax=Staphylotrichum tortipilum TaxID=2831512 RepID=A0AAN6RV79_9PEZI|nr:hypothetical protein C8A05DRAFT_14701 [Staphylotrichum longicolle]
MGKTIVILGASLAGVPIAHYLLKHTATKVEGLKVILVSPNTDMYWNLASIRAILPDMMGDDKLFIPLAPAFAKYPSEQYEIIHGVAEKVEPSARTVQIRGNDGSARTISYDDLVVATGASFKADMPFKNLSTTEETKASLHDWAKRIGAAKSIVVAGAGATGVELAGELGQEYAVTGKKEITLVADQELPFVSKFRRDVREAAKKELERLKVKVITNAKVTSPASSNSTTLTLTKTDGTTSTLQADLLIPTFGLIPNTSFLPASMLDARGYIKQTTYLRAEGHDDIFVVGDAGNLQDPQAAHTEQQTLHVVRLLEARALAAEAAGAAAPEYKPSDKIMFAATVGRNRGTGQMGNWKLWSWIVWFAKGRYLGTNYAEDIAKGARTMTVKEW